MRRVVSIWLPNWPTDRLRRLSSAPPPERPFVTVRHDGRRHVVGDADPAARARGIRPGMVLTQARQLAGDLAVAQAQDTADLEALARLAEWLEGRYCPLVALDAPDGLWLDIAGCAHLFGGEASLLADILARLAQDGIRARAAAADAPGAAHALARFGTGPAIVAPPGRAGGLTDTLPVAALRLPTETVAGLRRLGIETIGEAGRLARGPLARRFGETVTRRLDQLRGRAPEPLDPILPRRAIRRRLAFVEPIATPEALRLAIRRLVDTVCADLGACGHGARRLDLICERVDKAAQGVRVGTALASRDAAHLDRLLAEHAGTIEPGLGIEAMSLGVALSEPLHPRALALAGGAAQAADLAPLVDRLSNRLGAERLYRMAPRQSAIPERSVRKLPPLSPPSGESWSPDLPRPVRLLDPPEAVTAMALLPDHPPVRFTWRRRAHLVARADGPERIFGEWWRNVREETAVRDYFLVEDSEGSRFWLFRAGISNEARWFLHGLFG